jgi:DNA-binding transcriptional LysR family regulator
MPRISHLRAFLEAIACGSFIEASENLHLSESAVSARIKALESALGARLFSRSKHGVVLNDTGHTFLPYAETAVAAWQHGQSAVKAAVSGKVPFSIGIQQDLWGIFAAKWFAAIARFEPDTELSVICDYTDVLCDRVAQNILDVALIFKPRRSRGIALEHLTRLALVLISGKPSEWSGQLPKDYYYVDWGENFGVWHDETFDQHQHNRVSVSVSGMALSLLTNNGGSAYLLEQSVSQILNTGEVHLIKNAPRYEIDVFVVRPETNSRTKLSDIDLGVILSS